ncbi:MAG: hypothetical protein KDA69_03030 [Planctomycetaceae bacterium]|nr:hypothetical protein [Planctomycetaceae bacterium]
MSHVIALAVGVLLSLPATGCSQGWHEKHGWDAEAYFTDPQVVALCQAIEAKDVEELDRLAKAGANVNAVGKDNMTPLLWAFPEQNTECFKRLLELGANPNVMFDGRKIPPRGAFWFHDSVTHMSLRTARMSYFELVYQHGGDPKLIGGVPGETDPPIITAVQSGGPDRKKKIEQLLELGADIHQKDSAGREAVTVAVGWGGQYELALWLLKKGADPKAQRPDQKTWLIHKVLVERKRARSLPEEIQKDYDALVAYLEEQGESLEQAEKVMIEWGYKYE